MDQVPKILKPLVENWIPESFVVSFKVSMLSLSLVMDVDQLPILICERPQLETDPQLLIPKARTSLERYGHQVVIGNMLDTRKYEVVFVSSSTDAHTSPNDPPLEAFKEEWTRLPGTLAEIGSSGEAQAASAPAVTEIEELIVGKLVDMHAHWIDQSAKTK